MKCKQTANCKQNVKTADYMQMKYLLKFNENEEQKIHRKVIAFLWLIRFGNYKSDLMNIADIGIKQLALNEFVVDEHIIEQILGYSHQFVMDHSVNAANADMNKLMLPYLDEDEWMLTAFEMLFKLDNVWIDWIAEFCIPQLSDVQINKIKASLHSTPSKKEVNKFIRRISIKSFASFCKINLFGKIDSVKMQNIIKDNYENDEELASIIMHANFDIVQAFGNLSTLYNILNDDELNETQIDNILSAIHMRIDGDISSAKLIVNDLLFGKIKWAIDDSIWNNILLAFDPKYPLFRRALNDLFYELATEQHHEKMIFFLKCNRINFDYCLNEDLIEYGLQSLMIENSFHKKATCVQLIGDWIYANYQNETNLIRRKQISQKVIANLANILSSKEVKLHRNNRDQMIIEQYLAQLKSGLSR